MISRVIILAKSDAVCCYFKNKSNFVNLKYAVLFEGNLHYQAFLVGHADASKVMDVVCHDLKDHIMQADACLLYGSERDSEKPVKGAFHLREFPVLDVDAVKEFYNSITPEIATYFLKMHHLIFDYDYFSATLARLYVCTKSEPLILVVDASNEEDEARHRFPDFYKRLDKLIAHDLGGAHVCELVVSHDHSILEKSDHLPSVAGLFGVRVAPAAMGPSEISGTYPYLHK
tara:strand:- start:243 stop:932 length:690 start_codon:yes stop_codon:yes gene_type:complete